MSLTNPRRQPFLLMVWFVQITLSLPSTISEVAHLIYLFWRCKRVFWRSNQQMAIHTLVVKTSTSFWWSTFEFKKAEGVNLKDDHCKGTVGAEAGDLSEPAVRQKSHGLTTTDRKSKNINIKQ